jgi:hypothetical protein
MMEVPGAKAAEKEEYQMEHRSGPTSSHTAVFLERMMISVIVVVYDTM